MTFNSKITGGVSYEKACNYGMPHLLCHYEGGVNANRIDKGAICVVCGKPATNSHHEPPKGSCPIMCLHTDYGHFVLKPALIALCGSGVFGCHGDRHAGRVKFMWVWDDEDAEAMWWSGEMLAHDFKLHGELHRPVMPHSDKLWNWGHWEARKGGHVLSIRRGEADV